MFWSKLNKSNWISACSLRYSIVYFKGLHNDQEYYWPTTHRAGATVVSTITSILCFGDILFARLGHKYVCLETYDSIIHGIQALSPSSLASKGSPSTEWDEAVIWALVMLPSFIPRGSSHDPPTEKNKQTNKNKNKTRKRIPSSLK